MIALKCLQKDPDQRYLSAAARAGALDAFTRCAPVSARSTSLRGLATRLLGETHHAAIMENWGFLWICHSVALVVFFGITNVLLWRGVAARWPYILIFPAGLGAWAAIFWALRRRGGPISFVERQIAHVWAASVIACTLLFFIEILLKLPVLTLSPVLALISGMVFLVKAGILSGRFYAQAGALFLTAGV